jgi:hypothetical protein
MNERRLINQKRWSLEANPRRCANEVRLSFRKVISQINKAGLHENQPIVKSTGAPSNLSASSLTLVPFLLSVFLQLD